MWKGTSLSTVPRCSRTWHDPVLVTSGVGLLPAPLSLGPQREEVGHTAEGVGVGEVTTVFPSVSAWRLLLLFVPPTHRGQRIKCWMRDKSSQILGSPAFQLLDRRVQHEAGQRLYWGSGFPFVVRTLAPSSHRAGTGQGLCLLVPWTLPVV